MGPHCPKQLLNNILWTNWEKLDEILILGNSISEIVASLSQNQLKTVHYLQLASELCKEVPLKNNFHHQDIFNNLSCHWFENSVILKSTEKPKYPREDLEFIKMASSTGVRTVFRELRCSLTQP